jgi:DNA (cytosine-5)-methyltransferase 1
MGRAYSPDEWDEWTERMRAEHGNGNGHGKSLHIEALRLLPTPRTSDTNGAGEHGAGGADLRTVVSLLPTPRATDGTKGGPNQRGSSGDLMLPSAVLLPTPTSSDHKASGASYAATETHNPGTTLTDATVRQAADFGRYAPAIARWEALTRPAPAPTEPTGKNGAHRLSPAFVEWMMGLPAGWVTSVPGVTRNDQLKALGNGVVPQQATAAIRHLFTVAVDATKAVPA